MSSVPTEPTDNTEPNEPAASNPAQLPATTPAASVPAFYGADMGGEGLENADEKSYAIPFLQVLQKMSPAVDPDDPRHIEGAKAGMFFNSVTKQLYDGKEGLRLIQCYYRSSFILWQPREAGGGFRGEIDSETFDEIYKTGKLININGRFYVPDAQGNVDPKKNEYYSDTRSHYVLIVDPQTGELTQAIMPITATQIKSSKALMTLLRNRVVQTPNGKRTPPTFANVIHATTIPQSNEKGSWSGVQFSLEDLVKSEETYNVARTFYKALHAGEIRADYSKAPTEDGEVSNGAKDAQTF